MAKQVKIAASEYLPIIDELRRMMLKAGRYEVAQRAANQVRRGYQGRASAAELVFVVKPTDTTEQLLGQIVKAVRKERGLPTVLQEAKSGKPD